MSAYVEKRSTLVAVPTTKTISASVEINTPAANAWEIVGNFAGFHKFVDGLTRIEMTGDGVRSVRKKFFADGHVVLEQLNSIDKNAMVMTWSLIYTTLDINNLWASMRVEKLSENSCRATWDVAGEPYSAETKQEDFDNFLAGFAQAAMDNVKNLFELNSKAA